MKSFASALILTLLVRPSLSYGKPYGPAGCGLGSMIMGKDGNVVISMTLNGTGTQTFAILSGTSNCVDSGVIKKNQEARAFIELNQQQLATDIAKGGGETVTSLAELYSCPNAETIGKELQPHYKEIFPSEKTSASHIEETVTQILRSKTIACLS